MSRLHLDCETFSPVEIKKVTTSVYASHPETELLMLGWAVDDDPVQLWEPRLCALPYELEIALVDPAYSIHAYNVPFEKGLLKHKLGIDIPIERWRDSMVKAFCLAFPPGLDRVLDAIGLQKKNPEGQKLINRFSKPAPKSHKIDRYTRENKPEEWERFKSYCMQDVEVERRLYLWLRQHHMMSDFELKLWFKDYEINQRGVPIDPDLCRGALAMWVDIKQTIVEELQELTGLGKVTRDPFLFWLACQGCILENTQKDTVTEARKGGYSPTVVRALELWSYKEVRALDKYNALLRSMEGGVVRGMFQYGGASRTLRWAGRLVQMHNLKRTIVDPEDIDCLSKVITDANPAVLHAFWPDDAPSELLGSAVRHAIRAPEGMEFVVADLDGIESRVLAVLTQCPAMIQIFEDGRDTYKVFAVEYFGVPYDEVTKEMRNFSKPPVLGCGYGLGWKGLISYASGYGIDLSDLEAKKAVDIFRTSYAEVPVFWYWLNSAVKACTLTGNIQKGYGLVIHPKGPFLCIRLPSGRDLWYFQPKVLPHKTPWGEVLPTFSYMGLNKANQWVRIFAAPGHTCENVDQAIARDHLANGMAEFEARGGKIVLHVHDEIGALSPYGMSSNHLKCLIESMTTNPWWDKKILLGASGYIATRFRKD